LFNLIYIFLNVRRWIKNNVYLHLKTYSMPNNQILILLFTKASCCCSWSKDKRNYFPKTTFL